jgi:hypothetical protein
MNSRRPTRVAWDRSSNRLTLVRDSTCGGAGRPGRCSRSSPAVYTSSGWAQGGAGPPSARHRSIDPAPSTAWTLSGVVRSYSRHLPSLP